MTLLPLTNQELNAMIAQEAERFKTEELQPDDWTLERAMKEHKLAKGQARKVMNIMVEKGMVRKIWITNPNGGGRRVAYRPVQKKQ